MAGTLRFVLGDQLTREISSLRDLEPAHDIVLICEVWEEATYVRHHPKKIAFLFSAMRHFAADLRNAGVTVRYVRLDDPENAGSLRGELVRAARLHAPERIVVTEPGEHRVLAEMQAWQTLIGIPIEIRTDDRFFCSRQAFARWAEGRRQLVMEFFYREMRQGHCILLDAGGVPYGGRWNLDRQNRKPLPADVQTPPIVRIEPDEITEEVLDLVRTRFPDHFGDLDPFGFAVTASEAERVFDRFIEQALPQFGDYQDAMRHDAPVLFHSFISLYMNAGLLDPRTVCRRVQAEYEAGSIPLNAAEGYIRQILGWREYMRGVYWLHMPAYAETNHLRAHRPLPAFYWTGETDMNCLAQVIGQTKREAYAHHIQRLMVTGNFALLIGALPREVCEWYLIVYADAYEWVELPNTHGMSLYADGGILGSKPYAASGNYINKMSDYCRHCRYDPKQKTGPNACPFNYLYWNFLIERADELARNKRLEMPYRTLARMDAGQRRVIQADARRFMDALPVGY